MKRDRARNAAFSILLVALAACVSPSDREDVGGVVSELGSAPTDPAAAETQFFDLLNQTRAANGLAPLVRDPGLDGVARDWSQHMGATFARTGTISSPGAPVDCEQSALCHRPNLLQAAMQVEPALTAAGENVGVGGDVQGLHQAFVNSPGHFANIIGKYNRLGVGVVLRGDKTWVTFNFIAGPSIAGPAAGPTTNVEVVASDGTYVPRVPLRVLDTRNSPSGPLGAGAIRSLSLPAANGRRAALLNVTVTEPRAAGYVAVYPCGGAVPLASNLNFSAGETIPNAVLVAAPSGTDVCFYSSAQTHLVVDEMGEFADGGSRFSPRAPQRVLDSRSGVGGAVGRVAAGEVRALGMGNLPSDATSALLNVTVTEPLGAGFVTAFPCSSPLPNASNLNFVAGQTIPNQVTATIGTGRDVCFFASESTHLVVDLGGVYGSSGDRLFATKPLRLLDTREGLRYGGKLTGTLEIPIGGANGIPVGATAVTLNVTVTEPDAAGYLTAHPCGEAPPLASNLNFVAGKTIPNLVTTKLGANGKLCLTSSSRTHVIADIAGYYAP